MTGAERREEMKVIVIDDDDEGVSGAEIKV